MLRDAYPGEDEVVPVSLIPIPSRIAAAERELSDLLSFPLESLVSIIREVGFRCNLCGRCCTRAFNGHVFLLDGDIARAREIDPESVEPAPYPEFCDQNGTFYVSGYALRVHDDESGSCYFLENGRCRIYDQRFAICRVYPYMLHREPDERGTVDWRQIAGLNEHGEYHTGLSEDLCRRAAVETLEYETACIRQEISFLEYIQDFFSRNQLRHVQKTYDDRLRAFARGDEIRIMVFFDGRLEEHRIRSGRQRWDFFPNGRRSPGARNGKKFKTG
jgi:Fe-S-cluster containining protein